MKNQILPLPINKLTINTHPSINTINKVIKFQDLPDIPALRQAEIASTDRDLGPKVPTILVIAGKKFCKIQKQTNPIKYKQQIHMQT